MKITLKAPLRPSATGITPQAVLEKLSAVQMSDVHLPTTHAANAEGGQKSTQRNEHRNFADFQA